MAPLSTESAHIANGRRASFSTSPYKPKDACAAQVAINFELTPYIPSILASGNLSITAPVEDESLSSDCGNTGDMMANIDTVNMDAANARPPSPTFSRAPTLVDNSPSNDDDIEAQRPCGMPTTARLRRFASKQVKKMTLKGTVKTTVGFLMCFGTLYAAFGSGCEAAQPVDHAVVA